MAAFGVFVGAVAGLPAMLLGEPFLSALWVPEPIPGIGKVGTVLMFDIGVFLTVIGVTTQIALLLAEEPLLFPMQSNTEAQASQSAPEA
jgi:multicomponent Na+:H+ antiporter subunit B